MWTSQLRFKKYAVLDIIIILFLFILHNRDAVAYHRHLRVKAGYVQN